MMGRNTMRCYGKAVLGACALMAVTLLSLMIGARSIPITDVWQALSAHCDTSECLIVQSSRVPRTLAGLGVGMALGVSGMLMQQLTRNPLADPGVLGINAGASAALVIGLTALGITRSDALIGLACLGALLACLAVSVLGLSRGRHVDPVRMTLAGVALGAVLEGITSGITLLTPDTFDYMRFWHAGTLDTRNLPLTMLAMLPIAIGLVLALLLIRPLRTLALGDEVTLSLGTSARKTRLLGIAAITLLCGSATACVGPIAFVGLMMPAIARRIAGPDPASLMRWTLLLTPIVLLSADIIGRVAIAGELRVSVMTALIGAPILISLVRRLRSEGEEG